MNERSTISNETAIAELTSICLELYARNLALFDLLQEVHGPIDSQQWKDLVKRRMESLFADLRADGWNDHSTFLATLLDVEAKQQPAAPKTED